MDLHALPNGKHKVANALYLWVRSPTSKTWQFRQTYKKKAYAVTLGKFPELSYRQAVEIATSLSVRLKSGEQIIVTKDEIADSDAVTLGQFLPKAVAHLYEIRRWKNVKHKAQWSSSIENHCEKLLKLPIGQITQDDILATLKPIWTRIPETASRIRSRLKSVFDLAIREGLATSNPAVWSGELEYSLPPMSIVKKVEHFAALSFEDTCKLVETLRENEAITAKAILFGILTATRCQEFCRARFDEIDFKTKTWIIPASRAKMKREHRVPLSAEALAIVATLDRKHEHLFVSNFSRSNNQPLDLNSPRLYIKSLGFECTMHGFRSTFKDWCERSLIHPSLSERCLAHVPSSKVIQAYQRDDLLEQRRDVMQRWADELFATEL